MADDLKSVMTVIVELSSKYNDSEAVKELTTAFRKLRNKCAEGAAVQNEIASFGNLIDSTFNTLQGILYTQTTTEEHNLCLLVGLQMIANVLVDNKQIQSRIWEDHNKKVVSFLWCDKPKVQNCAVMILHNVFLGHPEYIVRDKDIFSQIINLTTSCEFAVYLIQLYITRTSYVQEVYDELVSDLRLKLLDVVIDYVKKEEGGLGDGVVLFFVGKFVSYPDNLIDELAKTEHVPETYETVKILDLIVSVAGNEEGLKVLQGSEPLLGGCVKLLKAIHSKSKTPGNNLTRVQRLSELDDLETHNTLQEELSFGVKAKLIQLIGNLTWKHEGNQNKIREMDAIPVLLDCCSIDGRNPFILQWSILAIRNLCENNNENQKYIASVGSKGGIDYNKMKEMGILLNRDSDGTSMSIAPLQFQE